MNIEIKGHPYDLELEDKIEDISLDQGIQVNFPQIELDDSTTRNNLGIEKYNTDDISGAIEDFNEAICLDNRNAVAYYNRACTFLSEDDEDDYKKAYKDLTTAITINPNYAKAIYARGVYWLEYKEYHKAFDDFARVVELLPTCSQACSTMVSCVINIKGTYWLDKAISLINTYLTLKPGKITALRQRGILYSKRANYPMAIVDFDEVIKNGPSHLKSEAYYEKGIALFNLAQYDESIAAFNNGLNAYDEYKSSFYGCIGEVYRHLGNYDRAIEEYNLALNHSTRNAPFLFQRGIAKASNGDHKGGSADIIHAIKIDPTIADHLFTEEFMSCPVNIIIEDLTKAIELLPEWSAGYKKRASLKSDIRDTQGALEDFTSAIQLEPNNINLLIERAEINNNLDDAENDFKAALKLEPTNSEIYIRYAEFIWNSRHQKKDIIDLLIQVLEFENDENIKEYVKEFIIDTLSHSGLSCNLWYLTEYNGYSSMNEMVMYADDDLHQNIIINANVQQLIQDLNRIIEIIPEWDLPYIVRGYCRAVYLHNHENAIDDYNMFIKLTPEYAVAYYDRGESKFYIQDLDGAELDYRKAVGLKADKNFIPYELGQQYSLCFR